ncbi:hypothetical protein GCM10009608_26510 [Pseudonocardia alaniniphila]
MAVDVEAVAAATITTMAVAAPAASAAPSQGRKAFVRADLCADATSFSLFGERPD